MRSLIITFVFYLSITVISGPASSQEQLTYELLDSYIQSAADDFEMPGLAVGVVKDGEVVFLRGYGFSNTVTKKKVDENTLFAIASCSKAFTAACLAMLVDEGKISWEDRVVDLYPGFQLFDPYITRELMVRDLLSHRAGYETFDGDLLWYGTDYSREEVLRRFRHRKNEYSLREKYGYSNIMFIAAGEVIHAVTGMTWDEFVTERIFLPLGMDNSTTTNRGFEEMANVAWPHLDGQPMSFINYDNSGPAASINTSASELLMWISLMLNKGTWNDSVVFTEAQYYNLVSPNTITRQGKAETVDGTHFYTYGLGWAMKDYDGRKIIDHGGGLPGFHSKVVFVPEENLGYVILANEISALVPALEHDLLDFHLNDSLGWVAKYLPYKNMQEQREAARWEQMEQERVKDTRPSLPLESYTGTYEDEMYGKAEIRMSGNMLEVQLIPTGELFTAPMEHWHYDTFRIRVNDPFLPAGLITFALDEAGNVEGFRINIENPDFLFYKLDFRKL